MSIKKIGYKIIDNPESLKEGEILKVQAGKSLYGRANNISSIQH